jgi:hypothetical protein
MEKEIKELLDERQKLMDKVCFELIDIEGNMKDETNKF